MAFVSAHHWTKLFLHRILICRKFVDFVDAHPFLELKSRHRFRSSLVCPSINAAHFAWLSFHEEVKSEKILYYKAARHSSFMTRTAWGACGLVSICAANSKESRFHWLGSKRRAFIRFAKNFEWHKNPEHFQDHAWMDCKARTRGTVPVAVSVTGPGSGSGHKCAANHTSEQTNAFRHLSAITVSLPPKSPRELKNNQSSDCHPRERKSTLTHAAFPLRRSSARARPRVSSPSPTAIAPCGASSSRYLTAILR
jgi:hypothetical protein